MSAMSMEAKLCGVLTDFAHTLATDFSIQAILNRLVVHIVDVLPVEAAGVTLIVVGEEPRYVAASDSRAMRFEQLQTELGAGPCMNAFDTGQPVMVDDLRADERFGAFKGRTLDDGLLGVFAFPLRHGTTSFGAMNLYSTAAGPLDAAAVDAARTLADVTGAYLVMAQARADLVDSAHRDRQSHLLGQQYAEALRVSEARTAAILSSALDAIITMDLHGTVLDFNSAAQRLFGYSAESAIGRNLASLIIPEDQRSAHSEGLRRFPEHGTSSMVGRRTELMALRADGQLFPAEVSISLIEGSGEQTFTGFVRDLTDRYSARAERDELQHRLEQTQRMESLGQLAGGVAHDFNNLLMVIMSYANFIGDEAGDPVAVTSHSVAITAAAERAAQLTRQLLTFARREPVQRTPLDLNEVVEHVHGLLVDVIGDHVHLAIEPASGLPLVNLDRGQIEQVLVNLAVNARDAMKNGGNLTIRTTSVSSPSWLAEGVPLGVAPRWVEMSVADNGTGMSPEVAAQAFEPFFTTKAVGEGSGLGLATVYGIVTDSGGTLSIKSTEGTGTVVSVRFPATDTAPQEIAISVDGVRMAGRGQTVLVVEDQEMVLTVTVAMLLRNGYVVLEAGDVDHAVQLAEQSPFDLLLTDVVMPKMSGQALAERLRGILPALRVLYMSGYSEDVLAPHGGLQQKVLLLQKPFDEIALLRSVHDALGA